ncbi:MAG: hypothetical protein J6W52_04490 [Bacteroidaceae bacterium]|nr:hypothetical protein [Bacteroidaceae bacterium]
MKRYIIFTITMLMAFCTTSFAQNQTDTLRTRVRMTELTMKRTQLKQRIQAEDKKRNSQIADVAPGQMELINLRQDSLCLALRSQLTEVELEITELSSVVPGNDNTVSSAPQGTASVQQLVQSFRQNRPVRKDEEIQRME